MSMHRIALMASDFEDGGVERNFTHLARGFARLGVETWLLVGNPDHAYLRDLDPAIRVLPVRGSRADCLREFMARERPEALITGKLRDDLAAVEARDDLPAENRVRLVAAVGTLMSGRFAAHRWNPFKTLRETRRIRACYRRLDGVTAVSQAVAEDLQQVFGIREVPVAVLANPIIPDDLEDLAALPCHQPWLAESSADRSGPLIVALGGLRQVKDFATLLRAFARLQRPDARLVIIGEGKERAALAALARRLGIQDRVDLPGFVANPFPWLARADLLALSSRREGLPNALVEALALGIPVVATDCTGGVRELLQDGQLGPLVPVGDPAALADAMTLTLDRLAADDLNRDRLRQAAEPYRLIPAARAYLNFFRSLAGTPA
ncbi:glycosyltransferase involved in cell wall biosynthesis [Thiobaca trueperi]|uniref:Glycosyltransferase involved in cell wall biosynthesis n=2 Tax=Thiobaca trueperi TaxID=127458 RepID=A0A4R3N4M8_9GAMM|nr:glycosyltransferase involved in cell wall biosynthesis [Thiobaca trueperi]